MLAALNLHKYPYFDLSEIIPEPDFVFKPYEAANPLKAGDRMPDFMLDKDNARWQQFVNGAAVSGPVSLNRLLNKPLVIAFYSRHWQAYGTDLLKQLNDVQDEIREQGGNLLIISDEKERSLEKIAHENKLSLSFYFDGDKEIAETFRIYNENDPIWNKFSGIDANVPMLAAYVVSPSGQIEYDYIEENFEGRFPAGKLIAAVQSAAAVDNKIRNINNGVSR